MFKFPMYILLTLLPVFCRGQLSVDQTFMQLVRLYEQGQDSVFATGTQERKTMLLRQYAQKGSQLAETVARDGDSNLVRVSRYLHTALNIYAATALIRWKNDSTAQTQLMALLPEVDAYDSTDFPLRFKVLQYPIVLRYGDVLRDLQLYYDNIAQYGNCKQLTAILPQLKYLHPDIPARHWRRLRYRKCI